jgi:ParB family transcriptional regulator, chromosome partitioning protein
MIGVVKNDSTKLDLIQCVHEEIEIVKIHVRPRIREDPTVEIERLAESIAKHGLLHSIVVRKANEADGAEGYILLCGERRLEAFKYLGKTKIPAVIHATAQPVVANPLRRSP